MDGVALLEHEVRELIRARGVDPLRDAERLDALVRDALAEYDERSLRGHVPPLADPAAATKAVLDAVAGLGPLQPYLDDPEVEEIWINPTTFAVWRGQVPCPKDESAVRHRACRVALSETGALGLDKVVTLPVCSEEHPQREHCS